MKLHKKLERVRDKLFKAYLNLKVVYEEEYYPGYSNYIEYDICSALLNAIKALEFHYRDNIPERRSYNRHNSYKEAMKLLKQHSELKYSKNSYSDLILKRKIYNQDFMEPK